MSYLRRDPNIREFFVARRNAIDLDQFLSSNLDFVFFVISYYLCVFSRLDLELQYLSHSPISTWQTATTQAWLRD